MHEAVIPTPSPVRRSVQGSMPVGGLLAVVGAVVGYQLMTLSGAAIGAVVALSIYLIAKNSG